MQRLPKICPNLREIHLLHLYWHHIPKQYRKSIQQAFDEPNFTFPLLKKLHCIGFMNCNTFLERHPGIEMLECGHSSKSGFTGVLPNLRLFSGFVTDFLALFSKNPPLVEYLKVHFVSSDRFGAKERMRFINGLINTRTLRRLVFNDDRANGISLGLFTTIIKACPNLTHFTSKLGMEVSAKPKSVYSTILQNLADLEHLDLNFRRAYLGDSIREGVRARSGKSSASCGLNVRTRLKREIAAGLILGEGWRPSPFQFRSDVRAKFQARTPLPSPPSLRSGGPPSRGVVGGHSKASFCTGKMRGLEAVTDAKPDPYIVPAGFNLLSDSFSPSRRSTLSEPAPSLESYFCLSDADGGRLLTLNREISTRKDDSTHRILAVANALASLCVSKRRGQVFAIGIRVNAEFLGVYITENNGVPNSTIQYLKTVLSTLKAISKSSTILSATTSSPQQTLKIEDTVTQPEQDALALIVLKHTFPKFHANLAKRDKAWDSRVDDIRKKQLKDKPELAVQFEMILRVIDMVYKWVSAYVRKKTDVTLLHLYNCLSILDEMVRRSTDYRPCDISDVIELEDVGDDDTEEAVGDDNTLQVDDGIVTLQEENGNDGLVPGFSMKRFVYRIISVVIHIRRLIRIAISPTYERFFDRKCTIYTCLPVIQKIHLDPQGLLNRALHRIRSLRYTAVKYGDRSVPSQIFGHGTVPYLVR
ncbi:hypothetical protein BT96DRAFT_982667 [Gymnopus androsaceus JB14]|uniref:Uncharacterized protein n=1 Tax=Gymnopus androsaceus JB14 TaxID=1447944 RepID=A0A6A4GCM1_9AGAR|nr:hypothetical protein BT96DRAFT_982667 [Gymnopus androsaceus JB14]